MSATDFAQVMQEGHDQHGVLFNEIFANSLRSALKEGVFEVTFVKKSDYTTRIMHCTLNRDLICAALNCEADEVPLDPQRQFKYNPTQVRCFDLDKNEYRSFMVDSDLLMVECKQLISG